LEKDDDSIYHIDFITACSNIRARNYKIKEGERYVLKTIAGNINPAGNTSTSFITGASMLLVYENHLKKEIGLMNDVNVELDSNNYNFTLPVKAYKRVDVRYD